MGVEDFVDGLCDSTGTGGRSGTTWTWGNRARRSGSDLSAWDADGVRLARAEARRIRRARRRSGRRRWYAPWTRWPIIRPNQAQAALRSRLAELANEADHSRRPNGLHG